MKAGIVLQALLVVFVVKLVKAGGDDPCYNPSLPFNKSGVLIHLQNIENVFRFINSSLIDNVNLVLNEPSTITSEQITQLQDGILAICGQFETLFNQAGMNKTILENATALINSYFNQTFETLNGVNIAAVNIINSYATSFVAQIYETALDAIAPSIGLTTSVLSDFINDPSSAGFPYNCIIFDIAYLKTLDEILAEDLQVYLNDFESQITS